ncbi:MAG: hypothetical protein FWG94_13320 [Oscillospiraceae bacterium]|nr:hypothetical protein [Oscillospiraceae bacterium]
MNYLVESTIAGWEILNGILGEEIENYDFELEYACDSKSYGYMPRRGPIPPEEILAGIDFDPADFQL